MSSLDKPLKSVVGGVSATKLEEHFGMVTVGDLLSHYPRRYAIHGELTDLDSLPLDEHVTVMAQVRSSSTRQMRGRPNWITEVVVTDGRGELTLVYFHKQQRPRFRIPKQGEFGLFAGKVSAYQSRRQLAHPEFVLQTEEDPDSVSAFAGALIPVYPATAKIASWQIRKTVETVLDGLDDVEDTLPEAVRSAHNLMGLRDAYVALHRPASRDEADAALDRLRFDEAFVHQVVLAQRRRELRALPAAPRMSSAMGLLSAFDARMPFELTSGQRSVGAQIEKEISQDHPMHRLLQGEVGSGKTVVALRAMLAVVDAGGQAALLAPTEILAQQHLRTITSMLGPLAERSRLGGDSHGTTVTLLTGSMTTAQRRQALLDIASGEAGIVIGTHALIEDRVTFADLALVVIDEQHRFGVEQRAALAAKAPDGTRPHVLVMTATPIPRTIAMTVFGDLDVSTLTEIPAGRKEITTHVVAELEKPAHVTRAWERIREEVSQGRQAYVVCPRIGDEPVEGASVMETLSELTRILSGLHVAALHGRMPSDEKDRVMQQFVDGAIDVLIATSVIEVGVDVPNASVMVVLDAERFGVSQVHQLRGRIGRGEHASLCLLITKAPLGSPGRTRLEAIASTNDGFALSRLDLEQRREGDVLGAVQSGRRSTLRLLEVVRDEDIVAAAREDAIVLIDEDPDLLSLPGLRRAVAALSDEDSTDFLQKA